MDKRDVDIVLIRMDKIGDLVLSLPVDEHPAIQGQRVHWFIAKGMGAITEHSLPKRAATEFKRGFSPFEFWRMQQWFRKHQPQTVIFLHAPWWVSCAAWFAGVPERLGRRSQWHSFLFLNLPIRQKRSASDRHESDFNFDLVEWGFNRLGIRATLQLERVKRSYLKLGAVDPASTLEVRQLQAQKYRVVHPGMAGSALNWPPEYFRELIEKFSREMPVVITGTKADQKYLAGLNDLQNGSNPNIRWLVNDLNFADLINLLAQARSVVAPSTGVLHLAASLGTAAIGIYSPLKVQHPRRWGPKGPRVATLAPEINEGEKVGAEVMRQISVDQVYQAVKAVEANEHSNSPTLSPL